MEGVREGDVLRIDSQNRKPSIDNLAIESALAIEIIHEGKSHSLGLTMRTPGEDLDLVVGMLYSEGIIQSKSDIQSVSFDEDEAKVNLVESCIFSPEDHNRRTTKTSACGICGKESISNLLHIHGPKLRDNFSLERNAISNASLDLLSSQRIFQLTGGTHAAALLSEKCELISLREDIGRHNALDKLVGSYIRQPNDMSPTLLLVSGRASFELVQKCIRLGVPIMASVGAASTLAVDMAKEHNLTLLSFVRDERMLVHSAPHRISNN
ncbi:MAG TPA: formate dehydrogenase accessory sulfurtransferase FdhD [Candidatus Thalassarchaeaceae archaeon]|jgi:FdhD protein|nr:formate dehydrogenase accessory sulfurtransferase FdhD [Candidatus Thalassarchaeaceae archaeon]HJO42223.1 formate dehydrogenase accessory sulfurtransferase FdhD [Candidatus Thalassarchaeaceae archaeon]